MTAARISINDFSLANPIYVGATVSFYTADSSGVVTTTLATLYDSQTGSGTLANPQTLDSDGKFEQPVYISSAVIGAVENANGVPDHSTGVIGRPGELEGSKTYDWASISAGATAQTTVTVTGAGVDDFAMASMSIANADIDFLAKVTSADTVTVTAWNHGAGAVDLASATLYVRVLVRS